jgi:signal transduction histidine kinase
MSDAELVWYRSLYWRVGIGFVVFLALLLVAQALLFVWLTGRAAGTLPAASNERLADLVAADVRSRLEADPTTDIGAHIETEYRRVVQTFVVVMADGRVFSNRDDAPPQLLGTARAMLDRLGTGDFPRRGAGRGGRGRFGGGGGPGPGRLARPIVVDNMVAGVVVVTADRPGLLAALRPLGSTLAASGVALLLAGAGAAALFIFGPVRRRLHELEDAAARIGGGDVTVRAPEQGRDEVAALARSFNRMAADLQARAEALSASDKARRQLLADVSHELMTPLTAMRGYLDTLAMAELTLDPPTRERYLRIVDEETQRLEHIIGDLLDLARLEGTGTPPRRDPVSVATLFDRVAARHGRELQQRGITLVSRVDAGAEQVTGDPDRLEQALQNLAANALRHAPPGGEIALAAAPVPGGVRLVVRDNGPGIAAEHLPLIFDRFYKVDAARAAGASSGSGLGLSIVKAIVERHGGTITVRNDGGALFEIVLPR